MSRPHDTATDAPPGLYRIGKHLWGTCANCGGFVKVTGWARGMHICKPDPMRHVAPDPEWTWRRPKEDQ